MKVTIADVARTAGVSTATVDRVVNSRNGVKSRTRDHVLTVAQRLGFPLPALQHPASFAPVVLDFVLPGGTNTYINDFAKMLERGTEAVTNVRSRVHQVEGLNPDALAEKMRSLRDETQGLGIVAVDHPNVREAVRELNAANVPVLTMVSDIPNVPRIGYVGIDNRSAGRLAGHLLGRLSENKPQKVALFAGSLSYRGHEEREMGFRHILAEEFPHLQIVQLRESLDDFQRGYEEVKALLETYPDVSGIYNIGGGNRGIAQALEESGRAKEVVFGAHELTEHTRRFLLSGVIDFLIDQNPLQEARESILALTKAARRKPIDVSSLSIPMQIVFRENISA
ncbi:MAG: LacI family DNA-binding transcriptional regulator [Verrucomicrobia bacterium]|nr:LacI family DNA-binding transcriptional regulator [Verrucomicrobiota bacterium]